MITFCVEKIVGFLGPDLGDNDILEIGPGPGMLTRSILHQGATRFVAIEKDERFLPLLQVKIKFTNLFLNIF